MQAQLDRELRLHNQGSLLLHLWALFYTGFIFISSYMVLRMSVHCQLRPVLEVLSEDQCELKFKGRNILITDSRWLVG